MNLIPGLEFAADGMTAEKIRLEVVAQNLANAYTTRGPDGQPYQRQVVSFEAALLRAGTFSDGLRQVGGRAPMTVQVAGIQSDTSPGQVVYNPGHPDADEAGMVRMPNVNPIFEMVDMMTASRSYEANLAVAKVGRQMASKTLEIGRF